MPDVATASVRRARPRLVVAAARSRPYLGGIESHVAEVAPRVAAGGYQTAVVSTDVEGNLPAREVSGGATGKVVTRRFRAWPRGRDYYASPGLFLHLLRGRYDILHVQGVHTLVPPAAMLAAALRRRPYVVTFHTGGSSSRLRTRARGTQFRLLGPLLRRACALVAVSEFEAEMFERILRLPPGSIRVVRNGGTLPDLSRRVTPEPDRIISIGRLERYKGHHRAIAALPHVRQQQPGAELAILGSGPYEAELRALADRLGVGDHVSIRAVDPADRGAMAGELARAAVSVLLSDYESHPVAVMESLAAGRPAVVAETSGMTELVRLGWVTGVDATASPQTVAAAIVGQIAAPRLPEPELLPTWDGCSARLGQLYADVIGAPA